MRALDETIRIQLRPETINDEVDDASRDSFPASDPPSWTGLRLGSPPPAQLGPPVKDRSPRSSDRVWSARVTRRNRENGSMPTAVPFF